MGPSSAKGIGTFSYFSVYILNGNKRVQYKGSSGKTVGRTRGKRGLYTYNLA